MSIKFAEYFLWT